MIFTDIFHIDEAFREYISRRLLVRMEIPIRDCRIEVPMGGHKTCLRIVKGSDGRGYVVRAYGRSGLAMARQLFAADDLFEKHNIPAPRIVDYAEKFSRKGVTFIAEEYLQGRSWHEMTPTPELARALGNLLARLHAVTSDHWGPITRGKSPMGAFSASQLSRMRNRIHRVKKFAPDTVSSDEFRAVREWFRSFRMPLDSINCFQLVHDKINPGNVYAGAPDLSRLYLLDFATLIWGCGAKDVIQAEQDLLGGDANLRGIFREAYFGILGGEARREFERVRLFYRAYYHLSRSAVNVRRDQVHKERNLDFSTDFYNTFTRHWQTLWSIVQGAGEPD